MGVVYSLCLHWGWFLRAMDRHTCFTCMQPTLIPFQPPPGHFSANRPVSEQVMEMDPKAYHQDDLGATLPTREGMPPLAPMRAVAYGALPCAMPHAARRRYQ